MLKRIRMLASTVRYLKPIQVFYQIMYRLRPTGALSRGNLDEDFNLTFLSFSLIPPVETSYLKYNRFVFLNKEKDFGPRRVDWLFSEYGKLWNYNLQYCTFLFQRDVDKETKSSLLFSLYSTLESGQLELEPYPSSLRIINVIRFYCTENLDDKLLLSYLKAEVEFLSKRCEYHLLGNHLLENAFALLMGGAFFNNEKWSSRGKKLLIDQLGEQILSDGAHFELSPMYHQIILFRVLELIDWYNNYPKVDRVFKMFIDETAKAMISWLESITFANGDIPHFNDSTDGVAYPSRWLAHYAKQLDVPISSAVLDASGYRAVNRKNYECRLDVAQIGAVYQPGHAHSDALSFILYVKGLPLIVDTGTSTYDANSVRQRERSTKSHNTVTLNDKDQSEVYGAFRVGRRATTKIISEGEGCLVAEHDGYTTTEGAVHTRTYLFLDDLISIEDLITKKIVSKARYHFHPNVDVIVKDGKCYIGSVGIIDLLGAKDIKLSSYDFAAGFNKTVTAKVLVVTFESSLKTNIYLKN